MLASAFQNEVFAGLGRRIAASDQVNIGAIGINGMGWVDLSAALQIPSVNVTAICDVDENVLNRRMGDLSKMNINTSKIKTYSDYRELLHNKDVDAVIIGTPDHWHALIMMDACAAGKDVYVEKPVGNSIGECRAMVAAQKKYNKVVQVGQWQRAAQAFERASALRPSNATILDKWGVSLQYEGDPARAVEVLQRAVQLQPDSLYMRQALATALAGSSRFAESSAQLRKILQLNPAWERADQVHLALGVDSEKSGDRTTAIQEYQRALALNPTLDFATKRLVALAAQR